MNNQIYKISGGSATVYVARDNASRLTQLKIYFNTVGKGPVVLKKRTTSKNRIIKNVKIKKADYESSMIFKHLTNFKPEPSQEIVDKKASKDMANSRRFDYFDYILPGLNHNITIVTPEGVEIIISRIIKTSPIQLEKTSFDYDVARVSLQRKK